MSPPTTGLRQSSRTKRNTLGVTPTSPPPIVVREQEQEEESKDFRETTLWRRGKQLKKKQYPGQGKVDDRKITTKVNASTPDVSVIFRKSKCDQCNILKTILLMV